MKFILYSIIAHILFFSSLWFLKNNSKKTLFNSKPVILNVDFISLTPKTPSPKPVLKKTKTKRKEKPIKKIEKTEKTIALKKAVVTKEKEKNKEKNKSKMFKKGATVDMSNFSYSYYLNLIQSRMYMNFHPPYNLKIDDKTVVLYFIVQKDGSIREIKFEKKAKSELLNRLALRAVKSSKLPPLPPKFISDGNNSLGVHFTFIYDK